jgi:hypothetical protein
MDLGRASEARLLGGMADATLEADTEREYAWSESDKLSLNGSNAGRRGGRSESAPELAEVSPSIMGRRILPASSDTLIRGTPGRPRASSEPPASSPSSGMALELGGLVMVIRLVGRRRGGLGLADGAKSNDSRPLITLGAMLPRLAP